MDKIWYHFIDRDDTFYDVCTESFKEAVLNLAQYNGKDSELFRKCLNGFEDNDVAGIVELYNHFAYTSIGEIYVVEKAIYPNKESIA